MKFTMQECGDAGFALLVWANPRNERLPHMVRMPIEAVHRILDLQEAAEALLELDAARAAMSDLIEELATPGNTPRDWDAAGRAEARRDRARTAVKAAVAKLKNPMREVIR